MKRTTFTAFLVFISIFCFSQSLVTTNKTWSNLKVHYWNPNNTSTEFFKLTTDSTIDGHVYKQVEQSTDENQQIWAAYGFIREDSDKKVFFRFNAIEPEYLFYDFNVELNDTIAAYSVFTFSNTTYIHPVVYYVHSIDSILIGDNYRKQINLYDTVQPYYDYEHWIDSTGNTGGLLHNDDGSVGRDTYYLLCFYENGIIRYHRPGYSSCYILTGTGEEHFNNVSVKISSNPMTESSIITVEQPGGNAELQIDFFDFYGRPFCSKKICHHLYLKKEEFRSGIYLYRITGKYGSVLSGKLVVI